MSGDTRLRACAALTGKAGCGQIRCVPQRDVTIRTEDGTSSASFHTPDGDGPWPAVIMYPDAGGLRDTMREMGDQLAGLGYATLVPDFYYRHGGFAPFDMRSVFADPAERERIIGMVMSVTAEMAVTDARSYVSFVLSQPEVAGSAVGTTGYCMGGRLSLIVAGHLGDQVAAAASFHGGNIAAADDPESPHRLAALMAAEVYVAGATDDASLAAAQRDRLEEALTAAGVPHTIETYAAAHGFAVPDNATYDPAAAQRHWDATASFFGRALRS
jgi:carboxymethylenebutenolidase